MKYVAEDRQTRDQLYFLDSTTDFLANCHISIQFQLIFVSVCIYLTHCFLRFLTLVLMYFSFSLSSSFLIIFDI